MGWSKSKLASEAGMPESTLRHFNKPNWDPRSSTLRKLESVVPQDFDPGHGVI